MYSPAAARHRALCRWPNSFIWKITEVISFLLTVAALQTAGQSRQSTTRFFLLIVFRESTKRSEKYASQGIDVLTYTPEHILSGIKSNQYTELESRINQMPVIDASENFLDCVPDDPNKFLVTGDPAVLDQIRKELSKQFHSYLSVYCSDPFFVEVMPAGIDKAHSLLKLLTSIGLTTEQMICCGDGYNDLTMIETAGLGVAMANAQPAVRETADYITKSNDEDGVLHVINEFMR